MVNFWICAASLCLTPSTVSRQHRRRHYPDLFDPRWHHFRVPCWDLGWAVPSNDRTDTRPPRTRWDERVVLPVEEIQLRLVFVNAGAVLEMWQDFVDRLRAH